MLPTRAVPAQSPSVDELLLATLPLVPVPQAGIGFANEPGVRLLVARNGVFIEGDNDAMSVRLKVGEWLDAHLRTPFGEVDPSVQHQWKVPQPDLQRWRNAFIEQARAAWPMETAACVYFNRVTGHWRYDGKIAIDASRSHVRYRPAPGPDEVVIFDLHSHGALPAFFSPVDDADDRADGGAVKVAFVFGRVQQTVVDIVGRFVVGGAISPVWKERTPVGAMVPAPTAMPELLDDDVVEHSAQGAASAGDGEPPWAAEH